MTEIQGTFVFEGQIFKAGYRYNYPSYQQGGYDKCLVIYYKADNQFIHSHDVFGDDKFEVDDATITDQKVILTLHFPLCRKEQFIIEGSKTIILKRF